MAASMNHLPVEIQTFILSKLDGNSAGCARQVCRLWNLLISGLESDFDFWLRHCLKEISPYSLVAITRIMTLAKLGEVTPQIEELEDLQSNLYEKLPWQYWQQVYAEYSRFRYIKTRHERQTELYFFPLFGEVTCLYLQDNVIYSGHTSGHIMSWQNIEDDLHGDVLYTHKRLVTSIRALDMVKSTDNLMSGQMDQVLVSSSADTTVMLYNIATEQSQQIKCYSKPVNSVRCWGKCFIVAADDTMYQGQPIWRLVDTKDLSTEVKVHLRGQQISTMKAVDIWHDTVVTGDVKGNLFRWTNSGELDSRGSLNSEDMVLVTCLHSPIKSLHLLGTNHILCHTADGELHISKDGSSFTSHCIYKCVNMTLECVTVHGPILALGFQSGCVYLYLLMKEQDWDTLDLSKPSRVVRTGKDHVNDIVMGDDQTGPVVVIATEGNCLTVVQWKNLVGSSLDIKSDKQETEESMYYLDKQASLKRNAAKKNGLLITPVGENDSEDEISSDKDIPDNPLMADSFIDGIKQDRPSIFHVNHKRTLELLQQGCVSDSETCEGPTLCEENPCVLEDNTST